MARPELVQIPPQPLERYRELLGDEFPLYEQVAERARERFAGRAIWHVNSTARGGGVAEILHSLLPYVRGVGVDTRWAVLHEEPEFFAVTKRLHNHLHEDAGDGGPLGEEERRLYESALRASAAQLAQLIQPEDIVYLHDPQTAGLVPAVKEIGVKVVWRCHIGVDRPGPLARGAWDFLRPYLKAADAYVYSRKEYIWAGLDEDKVWLMPPSIDSFSPKNQELEPEIVRAIIGAIGLGSMVPRRRRPSSAATARQGGSSAAPNCSRRGRCRWTRSWWPRSRAGIGSRTRTACLTASPSTSRARALTWRWSGQ